MKKIKVKALFWHPTQKWTMLNPFAILIKNKYKTPLSLYKWMVNDVKIQIYNISTFAKTSQNPYKNI
jgi:hypothetical protein